MPDQAPVVQRIHTSTDRTRRRKPPQYEDRRPNWNADGVDVQASQAAHYEICDAILRNNYKQAMHALGITRWEQDGLDVEFDKERVLLVNPNLLDVESPWAWQFFRRDRSHRCLLHEAVAYSSAMFGHSDDPTITKMLLARNAMVELIDDSGNTPLHIAAYANNVVACRLLVEAGANVNLRSRRGQTPLHTGVHHGSTAVCEYLLSVGADSSVKNVRGETPPAMANAMEHSETYAALMSGKAKQAMIDIIASSKPETEHCDEPARIRSRLSP